LRATPIAEAMVALTLMDHYLRDRAQNADVERAVGAAQQDAIKTSSK
jgi:chorismate synthase